MQERRNASALAMELRLSYITYRFEVVARSIDVSSCVDTQTNTSSLYELSCVDEPGLFVKSGKLHLYL